MFFIDRIILDMPKREDFSIKEKMNDENRKDREKKKTKPWHRVRSAKDKKKEEMKPILLFCGIRIKVASSFL